jgi:hypothetical protein
MKFHISFIACLTIIFMTIVFILSSSHSFGEPQQEHTPDANAIHPKWEYAQLKYSGTFDEKFSEHVWHWASSEDGWIRVRDKSPVLALSKIRGKLRIPGVPQPEMLDVSPVPLLDIIGAKGWELVHYFEKTRDLSTNYHKPSVPSKDTYEYITQVWHFKRVKAPSRTIQPTKGTESP